MKKLKWNAFSLSSLIFLAILLAFVGVAYYGIASQSFATTPNDNLVVEQQELQEKTEAIEMENSESISSDVVVDDRNEDKLDQCVTSEGDSQLFSNNDFAISGKVDETIPEEIRSQASFDVTADVNSPDYVLQFWNVEQGNDFNDPNPSIFTEKCWDLNSSEESCYYKLKDDDSSVLTYRIEDSEDYEEWELVTVSAAKIQGYSAVWTLNDSPISSEKNQIVKDTYSFVLNYVPFSIEGNLSPDIPEDIKAKASFDVTAAVNSPDYVLQFWKVEHGNDFNDPNPSIFNEKGWDLNSSKESCYYKLKDDDSSVLTYRIEYSEDFRHWELVTVSAAKIQGYSAVWTLNDSPISSEKNQIVKDTYSFVLNYVPLSIEGNLSPDIPEDIKAGASFDVEASVGEDSEIFKSWSYESVSTFIDQNTPKFYDPDKELSFKEDGSSYYWVDPNDPSVLTYYIRDSLEQPVEYETVTIRAKEIEGYSPVWLLDGTEIDYERHDIKIKDYHFLLSYKFDTKVYFNTNFDDVEVFAPLNVIDYFTEPGEGKPSPHKLGDFHTWKDPKFYAKNVDEFWYSTLMRYDEWEYDDYSTITYDMMPDSDPYAPNSWSITVSVPMRYETPTHYLNFSTWLKNGEEFENEESIETLKQGKAYTFTAVYVAEEKEDPEKFTMKFGIDANAPEGAEFSVEYSCRPDEAHDGYIDYSGSSITSYDDTNCQNKRLILINKVKSYYFCQDDETANSIFYYKVQQGSNDYFGGTITPKAIPGYRAVWYVNTNLVTETITGIEYEEYSIVLKYIDDAYMNVRIDADAPQGATFDVVYSTSQGSPYKNLSATGLTQFSDTNCPLFKGDYYYNNSHYFVNEWNDFRYWLEKNSDNSHVDAHLVPKQIEGYNAVWVVNDEVMGPSKKVDLIYYDVVLKYVPVNTFSIGVSIDKSTAPDDAEFMIDYTRDPSHTGRWDDLSTHGWQKETWADTNTSKFINFIFEQTAYNFKTSDKSTIQYTIFERYGESTYVSADIIPKAYDNKIPVWDIQVNQTRGPISESGGQFTNTHYEFILQYISIDVSEDGDTSSDTAFDITYNQVGDGLVDLSQNGVKSFTDTNFGKFGHLVLSDDTHIQLNKDGSIFYQAKSSPSLYVSATIKPVDIGYISGLWKLNDVALDVGIKYNLQSKENKLVYTWNKGELSITKDPIASSLTYGQKLSESQLTGGEVKETTNWSIIPGEFVWSSPDTIPSAGSTKKYEIKFVPTQEPYKKDVVTGEISLIVSRRPITIQSQNGNWDYDGNEHSFKDITIKSGSWVPGQGADYNNFAKITDYSPEGVINTFDCTAKPGTDFSNYDITKEYGKLTINRINATITADDKTVGYGDEPVYTYSSDEVVEKDKDRLPITYVREPGIELGNYTITPSCNSLDAPAINYIFTFKTGTLTITKKTATISADNKTKAFGQEDPELTVTCEGFAYSDMPEKDVHYTVYREKGEDLGDHNIVVTIIPEKDDSINSADLTNEKEEDEIYKHYNLQAKNATLTIVNEPEKIQTASTGDNNGCVIVISVIGLILSCLYLFKKKINSSIY